MARHGFGAQGRRRAVGAAGSVAAFLAFGAAPMLVSPAPAQADETDLLGDLLAGLFGHADTAGDAAAGAASGAATDGWVHSLEQDWINSDLGKGVDGTLNYLFNLVDPSAALTTGTCGLICNGADGILGGTLAQSYGHPGGLIFGDDGTSALPMSQNLLVNPGFETADPSTSGFSGVTIPGWTETGTPTVIPYGTPFGYPSPVSSPIQLPWVQYFPQDAPPGGGDNFASGGPVATSSISQTVDLTGAAGTPYQLSADLGGQGWNPSYTTVQVTFHNADGDVLGSGSLNPVTIWDRWGFTGFQERDISGIVPVGTTSAQVTTTFNDENGFLGNYNGADVDNESFTVGDPSLTAAPLTPPTSDVGQLNHVFVIYMENKGVGDIVGSPNAPYINSLINNYGSASNYFALGHPSDPNYIRVVGGSDFGIDYNPATAGINAPSLMQDMDQAGVSWAGYAQSMPQAGDITSSGDYDVNELPFAQFSYVHDNTPSYLAQHLLPLTQLSTDLANPSSFPGFTWIAADEAHNGEGPVDSLSGILSFLGSQLTNHQYNVAAADQFVQQEITTIEHSATWTDPNEKDAIFLTFDEDNNNLSLGIGNEGNNVPMIVIPNSDAVTAGGMQGGHFTTDAHYDEYSLMATIEDALRGTSGAPLAPLTDNDTYAQPMNAFWLYGPDTSRRA